MVTILVCNTQALFDFIVFFDTVGHALLCVCACVRTCTVDEPRASHMLGKCSTTGLYPQSDFFLFWKSSFNLCGSTFSLTFLYLSLSWSCVSFFLFSSF
jgi:hypothetical protein